MEETELASQVSISDFNFGIEELRTAITRIPRPWIKDCRGIPPMALLGGDTFLHAILPPFKQLLAYDKDWEDLPERGYVKQKVSGGLDAAKLHAFIPQSTVMRLLGLLVKSVVLPCVDQYSKANEMLIIFEINTK